MKKLVLATLMGAVLWAGVGLADDQATITIKASIPSQQGLTATISRIEPGAGQGGSDLWTTVSEMDFGELVYDSDNGIFRSPVYFAVDVGVNANSGSWTITHEANSITNGSDNLDSNINVVFVAQRSDGSSTQLAKRSYGNSNNYEVTQSQVGSGAWLRIYYGIATGQNDAPGVTPITMEKAAGDYQGSVTLTLTVN